MKKYYWLYSHHTFENSTAGFDLIKGLLIAAVIAVVSGSVGSKWGGWLKKVQR